ncbi:hypothetical protein, conserved [Plasmodium gonderi]|uniref:Uncharacterized protein n=1 Tax=Plasmodium gonderi TaxID=77519 RepID=A0A1Y1JKH3_PLAGO|nr:hypothetical protein, conserved [Plasmodium gonderi]GAW83026.1 hypothetical protein, conserved [Plasmodium gonderi]
MDLEIVEEKIKKLEEEIQKFGDRELCKIERVKNDIELLDIHVKELKKKRINKQLVNANKSLEQKILQKKQNCNNKRKYVKGIKRDMLFELKLLKEEKKKNDRLLHKHFNFHFVKEFTNQVKQTFLVLNVQREFLFKSIFEKINKIKNKSITYFHKFLSIQKEIDLLFKSISNNALTDLFVLSKNSLFFQKQVVNIFQRFYQQLETSLTGL